VKAGRARGVVLANGDEIQADIVSSSVDPRLTFIQFIENGNLPNDFLDEVRRYKFRGSSGKVNLALDRLPSFTCMPGPGAHLRERFQFRPASNTWRRHTTTRSMASTPASLHRHGNSDVDRSFRSASGQTCHVLLRAVRSLQTASGMNWDDQKEAFGKQRYRHHR